ncbi:MAG TPA: hypothetical protein PLX67_03460, partial [bacterium]|nr:hypothetical protein [bacterium]
MSVSRRLFWLVIIGCLLIIVIDGCRLTRAAWLTYQSGLAGKQSLEQGWQLAKAGEWLPAQTAVQQA